MEDNSMRVNAGNNMYKDMYKTIFKIIISVSKFCTSSIFYHAYAYANNIKCKYFEIFEDKRFKYKSVSPQC